MDDHTPFLCYDELMSRRTSEHSPILNLPKIRRVLDGLPEKLPDKLTHKKKRPLSIAVVNHNCTGCEVCIPFCPVDCIEHVPPGTSPDKIIQEVQVRFDECIGCDLCVHACRELAWDAIDCVPTEDFEHLTRIKIGKKYPGKLPIIPLGDDVRNQIANFLTQSEDT